MRRLAPAVANAINRRGRIIYLRTETVVNEQVNPAIVSNPRLTNAIFAGAVTLSIDADNATGFLAPGDSILIGGQEVMVTAQVFARAFVESEYSVDGFDNVPVMPPIAAAQAVQTTLSIDWFNDTQVKALVGSFPVQIIDGKNFLLRDLRVQLAATGTSRQNPPAYTTQKLIIDGDIRSIISCDPIEGPGGEITKWQIQAR